MLVDLTVVVLRKLGLLGAATRAPGLAGPLAVLVDAGDGLFSAWTGSAALNLFGCPHCRRALASGRLGERTR